MSRAESSRSPESRQKAAVSPNEREPWNSNLAVSQNPRSGTGSACGKSIIIGEHAVVYGARAVAMPLSSMRFSMELKPKQQSAIKFLLAGKDASELLTGTIRDGIKTLGAKEFGAEVSAHSSLPMGAGLGSSAALCIATLRTLSSALGTEIPKFHLAALGNRLEKRFHGNPSGLDTAVVAYETPIAFTKEFGPEAIQLESEKRFSFALIDSGIRASTLTMIEKAKPYFQGFEGDRRILGFDDLANQVIAGIRTGDHASVGAAMIEAAGYLDEAGIVNPSLRHIMNTARELNVLAAKPTGAGGGGCVLCLLDPVHASAQLANLQKTFSNRMVYEVEL